MKIKKLNNLKLRTRTKVLIPLLIAFIFLSSAILTAVPSFKLGTDASGDSWTGANNVIRNSNNRCWEPTNENLKYAVYNLNSTNGGKVTIPIGTIAISSPILLPDNVWLDGQGNESKLILANAVNDDVIRNYDIINGNTGIKITNLHIDGNASGQTTNVVGKTCIEMRFCTNVVIDNCYVTNGSTENIWFNLGQGNTVSNTISCRAGANNESGYVGVGAGSQTHTCGIWFGGEIGSSVVNCKLYDNWAHGVALEGSYSGRQAYANLVDSCIIWDNEGGIWTETANGTIISNNICFNNTRTGCYSTEYGGIVVGGETNNTLVIGNICYGNAIHGIRVAGLQQNNITITLNVIYNHTGCGIQIGSTAYNCTVSWNTIHDNEDRAINFTGGVSPKITDNTINHCSEGIYVTKDVCPEVDADISRNTIRDIYGAGCYGIRTNIDDSVIRNNILKDISGNAIRIEDAVRQVIEGNQIETTITNPRDGILVYSTGSGCHNSTIRFNRISDCTRDGIRLNSCVDNVVSDNTFYGNDGSNIYNNGCTNLTIFDNTNYNLDTRKTMIWNSNGNYWDATGTNIQVAINDLTSGGTVLLPSGIIYFDKIWINDNIVLQGKGVGSTILRGENGANVKLIEANSTIHNFTIQDMTIDGNGSSSQIISLHGNVDFILNNLYLFNTSVNGLAMWEYCDRGIITNINARNSSGGGQLFAINNATNCIFDNLIGSNAGFQAMDFHTIYNCTISNLLAFNSVAGIKFWGEGGYYGTDNVIENVIVNDIGNTGNGFVIQAQKRCSFSNIHINSSKTGIKIDDCEDINLNNFIINDADDIAFKIVDDVADSNRINVENGIVKCTAITTRGFSFKGTENLTIDNLKVYDSPSYNKINQIKNMIISNMVIANGGDIGLSIDASSYFTITDSFIIDNTGDGIDTTISPCNNYKILDCWVLRNAKGIETGLDHNVTIRGCTVKDNSGDGIEIDSQNFTFVDHNTLWGNVIQLDDNTAGTVELIEKNIGVDIV